MTYPFQLTSPAAPQLIKHIPAARFQQPGNHFEIHPLEWLEKNQQPATGPGQPDAYEIIWIKNGSGLLTADFREYAIGNNMAFCLSPGMLRKLHFKDKPEGYYILVSAEFFYMAGAGSHSVFLPGQFSGFKSACVMQADEEIRCEVEEILIKMRKEFSGYASLRSEILKGLFRIFMLYLSRKSVDRDSPGVYDKDLQLVKQFMELLRENIVSKKMVANYAGELCVTPGYLNRVVKKVSGFTASYHIQQYIILEAKRQAIHSGSTMKEIAYTLGFTDPAHFSKFFKNGNGASFSQFKRTVH